MYSDAARTVPSVEDLGLDVSALTVNQLNLFTTVNTMVEAFNLPPSHIHPQAFSELQATIQN